MSSEFNIQSAFDSLRKEIQTDRLSIQKSIADGFERMHEKFDEHAISDEKRFGKIEGRLSELDGRMDEVEGTTKSVKEGFWWTIGAIFTAALGWVATLWS